MEITLRADIHAALVDDDVVVLDVAADSYACLPGMASAWSAGVAADGAIRNADLAAQLQAAGLTDFGVDRRDPSGPPRPTASARDLSCEPAGWRDSLALVGALCDVAIHYRGRSLKHILRVVRADLGAPPALSRAEVVRLSALFDHAVVWLPLPGKCLVRSFALLRFLQRRGQDAQWCFGVRTWPFSAHCWLQFEEIALDEHADQLRAYTVIHVA